MVVMTGQASHLVDDVWFAMTRFDDTVRDVEDGAVRAKLALRSPRPGHEIRRIGRQRLQRHPGLQRNATGGSWPAWFGRGRGGGSTCPRTR